MSATLHQLLDSVAYVSYSQAMIFDSSVKLPGLDWTDVHFAQGFARRESSVSVRTLIEFGKCHVTTLLGPPVGPPVGPLEKYERVVAVPFLSPSGKVLVEGPEESETERIAVIAPGHYRLVLAQARVDEESEELHLFFEKLERPLERSELIRADSDLAPPIHLLESAEVAGES